MKLFLLTCLKFCIVPVTTTLALIGYYFYSDPFKVIHHYDDYSYSPVMPNRDVISTQSFIDRQGRQGYNSFIFGSSRTMGFRAASWKKHIGEQAKPFLFDASSESLAGIYQKVKYLDSMNMPIDNALILLCRDCSFANTIDETRYLIIKHPATSGKSKLAYHWSFLKAYFDNKFLSNYLAYQLISAYKPWMRGYINHHTISYDTVTNDLFILDQEEELRQSEADYYQKRDAIFYQRKKERTDSVPIIGSSSVNQLEAIKAILEKHKTNYKVVLSPLYEQKKYNPADLALLKATFGDRLYDFTGRNVFTEDRTNYYEASHFRPNVGDSIMEFIYSQEPRPRYGEKK